jgi:hypothetical protein
MITWDNYLFHYTNAQAILEIFRTRKIWATETPFLNDGFEGKLLSRTLESIADHPDIHMPNSAFDPIHFAALREHLRWGKRYFVSSFSKYPNMLTQFRMYCPREGGYVIGFPRDFLAKAGEIVDVEYGPSAHAGWCYAYALKFLEAAKKAMADQSMTPSDLANAVLCTAPWHEERMRAEICSKSNEFAAEAEVRLVKTGRVDVRLRASRNGNLLVPYIEIELPNEAVQVRIAPGPSRHRDLAQRAISELVHVASRVDTKWQVGILGIGEFGYQDLN